MMEKQTQLHHHPVGNRFQLHRQVGNKFQLTLHTVSQQTISLHLLETPTFGPGIFTISKCLVLPMKWTCPTQDYHSFTSNNQISPKQRQHLPLRGETLMTDNHSSCQLHQSFHQSFHHLHLTSKAKMDHPLNPDLHQQLPNQSSILSPGPQFHKHQTLVTPRRPSLMPTFWRLRHLSLTPEVFHRFLPSSILT